MKTRWFRPELIIMTRNHQEEQVLIICKQIGTGGSPNDSAGGCMEFAAAVCGACSGTGIS